MGVPTPPFSELPLDFLDPLTVPPAQPTPDPTETTEPTPPPQLPSPSLLSPQNPEGRTSGPDEEVSFPSLPPPIGPKFVASSPTASPPIPSTLKAEAEETHEVSSHENEECEGLSTTVPIFHRYADTDSEEVGGKGLPNNSRVDAEPAEVHSAPPVQITSNPEIPVETSAPIPSPPGSPTSLPFSHSVDERPDSSNEKEGDPFLSLPVGRLSVAPPRH